MFSRPRILVVDDEPSVLITYTTILDQEGYDAVGARSFAEAKEALDARHFDVLLCDYTLERRHSGFDVIDYARQRDGNVHPVLLTGFATDEVSEAAEKRKVEVLFKPVQIQDLLSTISTLLRRKAG